MIIDPYLTRVLYINLTNRSFQVKQRPELFEKYLGGTGVATALLHEECPENADPYSPDNPIIFAVGPLTGLLPLASKTVAMFKSPLTGNLGESHCGGRSAVAIRMAGYGAIVIKGSSESPVYLTLTGDSVYFRDASTIWGMQSSITVGRIIRENEAGGGLRTIMRIGGAGENLVRYACVTTETYRHFGRLGLGAVFGSKKLKALVVSGKRSIPFDNSENYRELYKQLHQSATESTLMKKYHDLGTADNIRVLEKLGGLPTRNLQQGRFEGSGELSGESLAEHYLGRRLACSHCPVGCIHIAALREPYADEPYFYKTSMISYDYEIIYALGSMLGISDPRGFLKLIEKVEIYGLDAMSTGVVLAWATEALQKDIISRKETMGLELEWGNYETYREAVIRIVEQPNDFYRALADGVQTASSEYGGKEFALSFGGNEMPGYHTGPAAHIGVLAGMRHSHLDNAGYSVDQKTIGSGNMAPGDLANALVKEESWRQVLSSLVVCFFARGIYGPDIVSRTLRLAGLDLSEEEITGIGREVYLSKYRFKVREGFSLTGQDIPERIFQTPASTGMLDKQYILDTLESLEKLTTVQL
ncbi:MAG: aldehyde ferredoxin oxidoreductase family protein [Dehalococcoidales bacterium]|nr:aldehyde ferredoxin oxidoreductase family protein [Dehalococcoidales bacterium]